jgi:threonine dehydrogenase-like Zn-dependent dehydrogenase
MADRAIRPSPDHERSLAKPCGEILVHPHADTRGCSVLKAVVERGLRVSSSRCGDFREALTLLAGDTALRRLGDTLVTHTFPVADLPHAFDIARAPECVKVLVEHDGQEG